MKQISEALQQHLESGATTLCWCWRMTRKDGVVLGFTDHDRDVVFEGVTFEAAAGFTASDMRESLGLGVDDLEVTGALSSDSISEADLAAGLFDDARVEIYRVNWQAPEQRLLMRTGSLGEVRRSGRSFTAEVRGLAHYLQQPQGRLFQYTCDADLGDQRCGVDVSSPSFRGFGAVAAVMDGRRFTVTGLEPYEAGWFTRGLLTFSSGAAAGQAIEVKHHAARNGMVSIELWQAARLPLAIGQSFTVQAGCDKHIATCRAKFANVTNYRGFPHMPGNEFITAYAGRRTS